MSQATEVETVVVGGGQAGLVVAHHLRRRSLSFVVLDASEVDPGITQTHSSEYRNPTDVPADEVLVVGAPDSGSEIALELADESRVLLSGRRLPEVPFFDGSDGAGEPPHERSMVEEESGLYFAGLFFLHALSSSLLSGVGRDAEHIA